MANRPKPGGACRGVVKPPNEAGPGGNRANHSYLPLGPSAGAAPPSGRSGGDRRRGCVPLGGMASPVQAPAHRFDIGAAKMPQPASAIEPGKGAIPVSPWDASGRPSRAVIEPDADRPPRR
jgi:hypothetical protein